MVSPSVMVGLLGVGATCAAENSAPGGARGVGASRNQSCRVLKVSSALTFIQIEPGRPEGVSPEWRRMTTPVPPAAPSAPDAEELIARVLAFSRTVDVARLQDTVDRLLTIPLTIRQLKVLGVIMAGNGTVSAQRLATVFNISLATVSGLVDRLVDSGTVVRVPSEADHRIHYLTATPAGTAILRELMNAASWMQLEALQLLALPDLQALVQGLDALGVALAATRTVRA